MHKSNVSSQSKPLEPAGWHDHWIVEPGSLAHALPRGSQQFSPGVPPVPGERGPSQGLRWRDDGPRRTIEAMRRGRLALTGALIMGIACGIDESQFTIDVCDDPTRLHLVDKVTTAVAVDYLDVREPIFDEFNDNAFFTLESFGSPCVGASDVAACLAAFDALPNHTDFNFPNSPDTCCFSRLIAFTRGDEVGTVSTVAELDAFLGSIDAPGDAALVMLLKHPEHRVRCGPGRAARR